VSGGGGPPTIRDNVGFRGSSSSSVRRKKKLVTSGGGEGGAERVPEKNQRKAHFVGIFPKKGERFGPWARQLVGANLSTRTNPRGGKEEVDRRRKRKVKPTLKNTERDPEGGTKQFLPAKKDDKRKAHCVTKGRQGGACPRWKDKKRKRKKKSLKKRREKIEDL